MKKAFTTLCIAVLFSLTLACIRCPVTNATIEGKLWGVIICSSIDAGAEAELLYETLTTYYDFDDIMYLHRDTSLQGVDLLTTRANISWVFSKWLTEHSTETDTVFIYLCGHGGGLLTQYVGFGTTPPEVIGGIPEVSWDDEGKPSHSDEGSEIRESALMSVMYPDENGTIIRDRDTNRDGDLDDWVGVDECLLVYTFENETHKELEGLYSDDKMKADLASVSSNKMVIVCVGCMAPNSTEPHCFSGGFIDDLSAKGRVIMTPTNETHPAYRKFVEIPEPGGIPGKILYDISFWGEQFINALGPNSTQSDTNGDGKVSMKEAFDFALLNDPVAQGMFETLSETPWLDDNGNGLPTYINETDVLDPTDGELASETFLNPETFHSLSVFAEGEGTPLGTAVDVYINGIFRGTTNSVFYLANNALYQVYVNDFWEANETTGNPTGYRYKFTHWENNATERLRNVTLVEDLSITAYFNRTLCTVGDVDNNGKVNWVDLGYVGLAYGSQRWRLVGAIIQLSADPDWDSRCDFDCNGRVEWVDLGWLGLHYTKER